jgi:hypothetical protein
MKRANFETLQGCHSYTTCGKDRLANQLCIYVYRRELNAHPSRILESCIAQLASIIVSFLIMTGLALGRQ